MMNERQLVLGDIHGELEALKEVFEKADFNVESDLLIQIGDLCDRGLYSYEVVELLMQCKKLVLIEGNHDQWLKHFMQTGMNKYDNMWMEQGGMATLNSYAKHHATPLLHEAFFARQLPYYIDAKNNCYVHGGFNRKHSIASQGPEILAWDRQLVNEMMNSKAGEKLKTADDFNHVYIGHTPTIYWNQDLPITRGGITNIDTGCGKGGKLTIMDVETGAYWQSS